MRAAVKFPVVLDMIRTQRVTFTSLAIVAPHLTEQNHETILQKVAGASKREAERVVACFSASKPKRDVIRPVVPSVPESPRTGEGMSKTVGEAHFGGEEKIARLKEIHAHKLKDESLAEVLEMAVDMLLEKTAPEVVLQEIRII